MSRLSLLIIDDHALVRQGLCQLLHSRVDIAEIREAATIAQAIETIAGGYVPDLVVLDLGLPDASGVQSISAIRSRWPDLPVLVLTMHDSPAVARSAVESGARGFVTKGADLESLIFAIRQVSSGARYYESSVMENIILENVQRLPRKQRVALSAREEEILRQLSAGLSVQDIANALGISRKTVSTYKARVMEKMDFSSNADLIRYTVLSEH